MSYSDKQPGQKLSKLSRSKRGAKKEICNDAKLAVKPLIDKTDLNETCDFKEPMIYKGSLNYLAGVDSKQGNSVQQQQQQPSSSKHFEARETMMEVDEAVLCQVCNKNISHMNSVRRQQHVNRCIDKIEEKQKEERKQSNQLSKANKSPVPDCPMCCRTFKSSTARQTHLKKCASINNVTTEAMLKLVKNQESETAIHSTTNQPSKTSKIPKTGQTRKRKMKEPKSQFDEDVQLALAVSSSLADQNKSEAEILQENLKEITGHNKKRKKKNLMEDVCLLTTLSNEDRQRRVEQKLHAVLLENEDSDSDNADSTPVLQNSLLKSEAPDSQNKLWQISNHHEDDGDITRFYVPSLMPPICTQKLRPGSNLRRLSSIPGREKTFIQVNSLDKSLTDTDHVEDVFTASTQTAVVLAELAVEESVICGETVEESTVAADVSLHASGFCEDYYVLQEQVLHQAQQQTLTAYKQMVNQSDFSDLTVNTSDNNTVHGHKAVIFTRFPRLSQLLDTSKSSISLPLSKEATLAFLIFVYTGELKSTLSIQSELEQMANELNLPSLKESCNHLVLENITEKIVEKGKPDEEIVRLNTVINMKDIWGESDNESDNEIQDKKRDGTDTEYELEKPESICDEDYYDIMCTQKRSNSHEIRTDDVTPVSKGTISKSLIDAPIQSSDCETCDTRLETIGQQGSSDSDTDRTISGVNSYSNTIIERQENTVGDCQINENEFTRTRQSSNHSGKVGDSSDFLSKMELEVEEDNLQSLDRSIGNTMNTSNVDLFESPSCEGPSTQSNYMDKSPTASKSPLFNRKRLNVISPEMSHATIHIDVDSTDEEDQEIDNTSNGDINTSFKSSNFGSDILISAIEKDKFKELANCDKFETINSATKSPSVKKTSESVDKNLVLHEGEGSEDDTKISDGKCVEFLMSESDDIEEIDFVIDSSNLHKKDSVNEKEELKIDNEEKANNLKNAEYSPKGNKYLKIDLNVSASDQQDFQDMEDTKNQSISQISKNQIEERDMDMNSEIYLISEDGSIEGSQLSEVDQNIDNKDAADDDNGNADISVIADGSPSACLDQGDVWEDFDDCGIGYGDVPSPVLSQPSSAENITDSPLADKDGDITLTDAKDVLNNSYTDNPTFTEHLNDDDDDDDCFVFSVSQHEENKKKEVNHFKTPTVNKTKKKKEWVPPSPFTPMPNYDEMNTPTLKKEVKKYGVRPVGKKRMVTVLKDIYHHTHQYETDSEFEDDVHGDSDNKTGVIAVDPSAHTDSAGVLSQDSMPSSQESDVSELMEESVLLAESTSESDTQSSPQKNVDVKKKIHSYITSNPDVHMRVLIYEPLEVDILKADLKEAGIKCSMDKLLEFLDEKCIAFTSKNSRKRATSKRGKKKGPAKVTNKKS